MPKRKIAVIQNSTYSGQEVTVVLINDSICQIFLPGQIKAIMEAKKILKEKEPTSPPAK